MEPDQKPAAPDGSPADAQGADCNDDEGHATDLRFARQGPQPADPGLALGAPAEIAAPVCRSACLQVLGIAGLEFVCIFGHDVHEYFDLTRATTPRRLVKANRIA